MKLMRQEEGLGLLWAIAIFSAWLGSGVYWLSHPLMALSWPGIIAGICVRTFFHTGLFILAHDAMHGNLLPSSPRWNHRLGRWGVNLYACLSYRDCIRNHAKHHTHCAHAKPTPCPCRIPPPSTPYHNTEDSHGKPSQRCSRRQTYGYLMGLGK